MKVVILAGGYGTRLSEESIYKPKPMIEIGGKPIIWHIMKEYSYYGFNDFIICAGYKQNMIKEWFADYYLYNSDVTFSFKNDNKMKFHNPKCEPWEVTIVDTGLDTKTGGRIKNIRKYLNDEPFMMTYGDGVCDLDFNELIAFHKKTGKIATVTCVLVEQNKGVLDIDNDLITDFREKSLLDSTRINGGYMVLEPEVFDYIGDDEFFERGPMERLARDRQMAAFKYDGFWQCMDTKREMERLESFVRTQNAPWMKWLSQESDSN